MTEHDARDAQTPEEWRRETIRRLREDLGIWLSPMAETVISHGIRYAQEQAHAAGKAEGADFIQRVAQLDPEHCGTDPEDDAQALRGLILIAREIAASKRSEAPDDR